MCVHFFSALQKAIYRTSYEKNVYIKKVLVIYQGITYEIMNLVTKIVD